MSICTLGRLKNHKTTHLHPHPQCVCHELGYDWSTVSKRVLNKDLCGILGPYWVLIYISGSLLSLFWFHSFKECQFSHICTHWFWFTLLANFDFYIRLRINFHTSSFWVLILAARGPYFTKKWVLIGSLSQSLGVLFSFWGSAEDKHFF